LALLSKFLAHVWHGLQRARTIVFFFSSRRRHTRSKRDWSSDVCSSDLVSKEPPPAPARPHPRPPGGPGVRACFQSLRRGGVELEIGRASCRERVHSALAPVNAKKK